MLNLCNINVTVVLSPGNNQLSPAHLRSVQDHRHRHGIIKCRTDGNQPTNHYKNFALLVHVNTFVSNARNIFFPFNLQKQRI